MCLRTPFVEVTPEHAPLSSGLHGLHRVLPEPALARYSFARRRGGIQPLCVSTPRELKSRPSTSPTHPGLKHASQSEHHPSIAQPCAYTRADPKHCQSPLRNPNAQIRKSAVCACLSMRSVSDSGVAQWLMPWGHDPKVRGSKPRSAIFRCSWSPPRFASAGAC